MAKISEWLLIFLANAAWQATFVAGLAAVIDRLLRTSAARYRHLLWVAASIAATALPLATAMRTQTPVPAQPPKLAIATTPTIPAPESASTVETPRTAAATSFRVPVLSLGATAAAIVCVLYGLLLLFRVAALAAAWRHTRAILREAIEVDLPPSLATALARCRAALRTRPVRVLISPLPVPLTMGFLRPVVILPARLLQQADAEVVTCAVGHELAHIARHDYLFNVIYELLALPLWFHPALALVLRRIRETREVRCDEMVTERLQDARIYAQSLVELAGAALPFGRAAATITVGIADADILEERVKTLLNRPRLKAQTILLTAAALLFAVPCVAAARLALRVTVHPLTAAAVQSTATPQVQAKHDFIEQHRVGDTVRGKIVKKTETRAVVELAPGVNALVRVPSQSSSPYDVGSEHDFQIARMVPEENVINLSDPSATFISPGNVQGGVVGGVPSGVVGGVPSGVVGGVAGAQTIRVHTPEGEKVLAPGAGYFFTQEQGSESTLVQKKLTLAQKQAAEAALLGEGGDEPRTPEARAKIAQLRKELAARENQQLMQSAREAKITLEQAISIAQSHQVGTVFETRLARERGVATYIVGIVSGDENNPTRTRFLINATDGTVMDTFHSSPNNE